MTVVVVGDLVTDVVAVHSGRLAVGSDSPARITHAGGGSAANTAAWLATLGVPVTFVGVVGADPAGEARLAELAGAGVRCAVRRTTAKPTGTVVVLASPDERTMLTDRGASALLTPDDVAPALAGARHLHLSGYHLLDPRTRPAGRAALRAATAAGATTSVDAASAAPLREVGGPAFVEWIRASTLLFATVPEAAALLGVAGGAAVELAARLAADVVHAIVKRGARGAVWAHSGGVVSAPAVPADAVDPTGAGDAFAAGVLAAWLDGGPPVDCLAAGARLGARAVSSVGGRPPTGPPAGRPTGPPAGPRR
jgi:sugar/nucleoside kinase (ribokinase family)